MPATCVVVWRRRGDGPWRSQSPTRTASWPTSHARSSRRTRRAPRRELCSRRPTRRCRRSGREHGGARLARAAPARGVRRVGLRAARARGRARGARPRVAPGPFLPTVIASALIAAAGDDAQRARFLPALADGSQPRRSASPARRRLARTAWSSGDAGLVLGAGLAQHAPAACRRRHRRRRPRRRRRRRRGAAGNLDPTRRSARVACTSVARRPEQRVPRCGADRARDLAWVLAAAEAAGGAQECVEAATAYAKDRHAVRPPDRHVPGREAPLRQHARRRRARDRAVWDAARGMPAVRPTSSSSPARSPPRTRVPAFYRNAQLNIQVHGGIGFTWEHDGHISCAVPRRSRRCSTPATAAAGDVTRCAVAGVKREHDFDAPARSRGSTASRCAPPPRSSPRSTTTRSSPATDRHRLRAAALAEAVGSRSEGARAARHRRGVRRGGRQAARVRHHRLDHPHAASSTRLADQIDAVDPTDARAASWSGASCSASPTPAPTPPASAPARRASTAAGRSPARRCGRAARSTATGGSPRCAPIPTPRSTPASPPWSSTCTPRASRSGRCARSPAPRCSTRCSSTDVFVPDDDVVGAVDNGWTVARSTLGNERVSIGGGAAGLRRRRASVSTGEHAEPADGLGAATWASTWREGAGDARAQPPAASSVRSSAASPGPEGNVTKLLSAEHAQRSADLGARSCSGPTPRCSTAAARSSAAR